MSNKWPFPKTWVCREIITDPEQLERIKEMFASYTLDDALDFDMSPDREVIEFLRNGSIYVLHYQNHKLQRVIIEAA